MIDWTKPLELMDGTPVRLETPLEMKGVFGGTNPDIHGDYWIVNMDGSSLPGDACQRPDTTKVRNRADATPEPETPTKTLRDEFAMAALTGILANPGRDNSENWSWQTGTLTGDAYMYADAMMKAREQ